MASSTLSWSSTLIAPSSAESFSALASSWKPFTYYIIISIIHSFIKYTHKAYTPSLTHDNNNCHHQLNHCQPQRPHQHCKLSQSSGDNSSISHLDLLTGIFNTNYIFACKYIICIKYSHSNSIYLLTLSDLLLQILLQGDTVMTHQHSHTGWHNNSIYLLTLSDLLLQILLLLVRLWAITIMLQPASYLCINIYG